MQTCVLAGACLPATGGRQNSEAEELLYEVPGGLLKVYWGFCSMAVGQKHNEAESVTDQTERVWLIRCRLLENGASQHEHARLTVTVSRTR